MSELIRILYLEDERDIRSIVEFALEDEGFELFACASGQEALDRAPSLEVDLILADVMIPGIDGPAAVKRLRELPHLSETPVIFMTAKVQPSELASYLDLGALGVIAKPFDAMTLAAQIRGLFEQRRATSTGERKRVRLNEFRQAFARSLPDRVTQLGVALDELRNAPPGVLPASGPLRRIAHSLVGAAGTFGYNRLGEQAHKLEADLLSADVTLPLRPETAAVIARHISEIARLAELGPSEGTEGEGLARGDGESQGGWTPETVFILEDDQVLAEEIAAQLRHFGYLAEWFTAADDLTAACSRQTPGALVVDVILPEGDLEGPRVAAELQKGATQAVPVVFVSVRDDWQAQLAAIRAGGQAYLPKPLDFGALADRIDTLTGRAPKTPLRVLILEDEPLLAEHYARVLSLAGMEVETVVEPSNILSRLSAFVPDLVLLDLYLPGCTGTEVAQVIRQNPGFATLPIVFLSTERSRDEQLVALSLGGDDFLEKPISDAHLTAAVASRAARFRALNSLATRDGLTGLLNHLSLKQALDRELSRVQRTSGCLSFAMLDLDNFKLVNDKRGHRAGDRVIRSLARLLVPRLRKTDLAGRYGGEEFALILPDTEPADAHTLVNELCQSFARIRYVQETVPFGATFSAGIAAAPPHFEVDAIIEAADRALYAAKRAGRNRVVIDEGK